ncbi:hypothetical protein SEA_SCENTAE_17 [Gordonia phage SCentae]|nr:hypothetical protein SEA_SCENTAE_17 [Gordonia phage SCentae]
MTIRRLAFGLKRQPQLPPGDPVPDRHPGTVHLASLFAYEHLPRTLQETSKPFSDLKDLLIEQLGDGPELSVALRKLVEAKDCAVRQRVIDLKFGNYAPSVNNPEPELRDGAPS